MNIALEGVHEAYQTLAASGAIENTPARWFCRQSLTALAWHLVTSGDSGGGRMPPTSDASDRVLNGIRAQAASLE
jgi:hypothetical protein